ncbi:hypothetical protein K438DRAFT_1985292 [Mycena galopus ATCC 62051]|nr:hypothetical protein K438DRAFT_1985292 [Mycena galopus ATCC 62051]
MDSVVSFNPNPTLGAFQIGVLISYVLFGMTTMQVYIYYRRFPEDSRILKTLTAFVWVCDVAHTICLGNVLYTYTISDFGHPERTEAVPRSFSVSTLFPGFIASCVQAYFSFRIYAFTKNIYIPCLIWFMAFLHLLGRIVIFATILHAPSGAHYLTQFEWLLTANWIISVLSDVVITTTLVVALYGHRSGVRKKTVALVDKLIVWTIETGMLTSVSSILILVTFMTMKDNEVWFAVLAVNTRRE